MADSASHNVTAVHITHTPCVAGGKPCIAGRRIRVQDVYIWHEHHGMSPDEIADAYDLTLVQVYAALTYAFEHIDAIHRDIQQSDRTVEDLKQHYSS
jgi:uncharacterized protein (DUF433 family)